MDLALVTWQEVLCDVLSTGELPLDGCRMGRRWRPKTLTFNEHLLCVPTLQMWKLRSEILWLVPKCWACWWWRSFLTLNLAVLPPHWNTPSCPGGWQYLPCILFVWTAKSRPSLKRTDWRRSASVWATFCPCYLCLISSWQHKPQEGRRWIKIHRLADRLRQPHTTCGYLTSY